MEGEMWFNVSAYIKPNVDIEDIIKVMIHERLESYIKYSKEKLEYLKEHGEPYEVGRAEHYLKKLEGAKGDKNSLFHIFIEVCGLLKYNYYEI